MGAEVAKVGRPYRRLLPTGKPRRTDDPGRRRLRHVAGVVDPQRSSGERREGTRSTSSTARARRTDLFYLNEIAALKDAHPEIEFIPVLSHADDDASWRGKRGFVHERVNARLKELALDGEGDVYACGPPPNDRCAAARSVHERVEIRARLLRSNFTTSSGAPSGH